MKRFSISTVSDLVKVVRYIEELEGFSICALIGDLGAGKTTLVKSWLGYKKVEGYVSSPTYAIINEYEGPSSIIYHMDLYRLKTIGEALEIGIEEYLHSGNLCLIEWPELITGLFHLPYLEIQIIALPDESREVIVRKVS
ncbi:MAG: tRNA threonylcarbamoyladenosine biosynthesis protein TsaE [Saprospiraceae bacterium]|jgi:tRNA threonylcarbamoyladenosine biosynthesis protein TsaE